jgi:hypothetical protein
VSCIAVSSIVFILIAISSITGIKALKRLYSDSKVKTRTDTAIFSPDIMYRNSQSLAIKEYTACAFSPVKNPRSADIATISHFIAGIRAVPIASPVSAN